MVATPRADRDPFASMFRAEEERVAVDKALRATFDALTEAGIWRDDKLVAQVTASKVHGVRPGARIHVEPIGGAS